VSRHSASGHRHVRPLVVALVAAVMVIGLIVADVVTLSAAKPSFERETRAFKNLIQSTSTTTVPRHRVPTPPPSPTSTSDGTATSLPS
jgi:hypothetical protein